jgi:hypothetical protein
MLMYLVKDGRDQAIISLSEYNLFVLKSTNIFLI